MVCYRGQRMIDDEIPTEVQPWLRICVVQHHSHAPLFSASEFLFCPGCLTAFTIGPGSTPGFDVGDKKRCIDQPLP